MMSRFESTILWRFFMVSIRLARGGSKKRPFYHVVVSDSRSPRDGRYIERIGFYNPRARGQEQELRIDDGRLEYWVSKGAQTSERVANLVKGARKAAA
jgi:small subunit ribosomal protein S16